MNLSDVAPLALVAGIVYLVSKDPRRNPDGAMFRDAHGVLHPIRSWGGYSTATVSTRSYQRSQTGQTAADQQLNKEFDRFLEKTQKVERLEEQHGNLHAKRDAIREMAQTDGAFDLIKLIRRQNVHGAHGGELDLIPLTQAVRMTGYRAGHFKDPVIKGGHKYVRREYILDELADEAGYRSSGELEEAILRANRYRHEERELDRQIKDLAGQIRTAKGERKAKLVKEKAKVAREKIAAKRKKAA